MKDLRITLIGSCGTGKTSAVEELARITKGRCGVEATPITGSLNKRVSQILEAIEWK